MVWNFGCISYMILILGFALLLGSPQNKNRKVRTTMSHGKHEFNRNVIQAFNSLIKSYLNNKKTK